MNTKQKGSIAEQAAVLKAIKNNWGVMAPIGDWLPYDLVFDVDGSLVKVQVKSAWFDANRNNYVVDNRRTKTNRRIMIRENYTSSDFDFALIYIEPIDLFYIMPVEVFISYASEIHLVETDKRQRRPNSANYRDAWMLIQQWASDGKTHHEKSVKLGETDCRAIPSQAPALVGEGVET